MQNMDKMYKYCFWYFALYKLISAKASNKYPKHRTTRTFKPIVTKTCTIPKVSYSTMLSMKNTLTNDIGSKIYVTNEGIAKLTDTNAPPTSIFSNLLAMIDIIKYVSNDSITLVTIIVAGIILTNTALITLSKKSYFPNKGAMKLVISFANSTVSSTIVYPNKTLEKTTVVKTFITKAPRNIKNTFSFNFCGKRFNKKEYRIAIIFAGKTYNNPTSKLIITPIIVEAIPGITAFFQSYFNP